MKKYLLSFVFILFCLSINAQTTPSIEFTAGVDGNERNLYIAANKTGVKLQIDWGDGNLVETEEIALADEYGSTTTITGVPTGTGVIKIYGEGIASLDCSSRVDGAQVTSIDVSNAPDLTDLSVYTNALTKLDVSKNVNLTKLNCYNNPITALDLSANTKLTSLNAQNMKLTKIDLSQNTALTTIYLSNNNLTNIDLSKNTELKSLYLLNAGLTSIDLSNNDKLTYASLNGNQLTTLDVTGCDALESLFCMSNQLTSLYADNVTKSVNCSKNNFTLATLPALPCKTYTYAPQNAMPVAESIAVGEALDLSAQNNITGLAGEPQATTYTWYTQNGEVLDPATYYTEADGVFTFIAAPAQPVYCVMESNAFPKFSGSNTFKTTETTITDNGDGVTEANANQIVIRIDNGYVSLLQLPLNAEVTVSNINGQVLSHNICKSNQMQLNLRPGLYIISINETAYKVIAQ